MLIVLCATVWPKRRLVRALGIAIASVALLSLTTSCSTSRKAIAEHSSQLRVEGLELRDSSAVERVEVLDTLKEVTTITIDRNDKGDTLKVVQITDRDRARNREAVRDKEERLVVRTDTVYVEKRDSSLRVLGRAKRQSRAKAYGLQEDPSARSGRATVSGKLSAVSKILKWITALVCAVVVLILVIRFLKTR